MSQNKSSKGVTFAPAVRSNTFAAIGALSTGVVFGISLCKSQVFRPDIIQAQLTMQNFTMIKMFLSAAMVSTITIQWLYSKKVISISLSSPSWMRTMIGGALLGSAMYISGACPGTALAQIGPGIKTAQFTLLGGVLGGLIFGMVEPLISTFFPRSNVTPPSVDSLLNTSKKTATVLMVGAFCSVLVLLEYIQPWQIGVGIPLSVTTWSTARLFSSVWSPYLAGTIIGLLQIPSFIMMNIGLGCSSGYICLISQTMGSTIANKFAYFKNYYGVRSVWQLFLDVGVIVGSGVCYKLLSPQAPALVATTTSQLAFLGGFVLIFGARLAGGCTSGHGLTGMGKLSVESALAVACMFGGGMLTAYLSSVLA